MFQLIFTNKKNFLKKSYFSNLINYKKYYYYYYINFQNNIINFLSFNIY